MPVFVDVAASVVGKETATLLETVLINTLNDLICERAGPTRQVMVMAEASARRYGRPVADILARRERWMEDMFATITAERTRRPRDGRDSRNSGDTQTTPPELNDRTEREKREAREQATQQAREAIAQGRPPVASQPQVGLGVVRGATSPSPSRHSKARLKRAARARDRDAWSEPAGVDPDMLRDEPGAEKS